MRTIVRSSSSLHAITIYVQRACDGCGASIGQPTDAEMDAAIAGAPLPDVTGECWECRPRTEVEQLADQVLEAAVLEALEQLCVGEPSFVAYMTLWHAASAANTVLTVQRAAA